MLSSRVRRRGRRAAAVSAVVLAGATAAMPARSADPDLVTDQLSTATPIKHVIVVIGENRTFDHIYGTYVPKSHDSIFNLLSEGIVTRPAHPGRISPQRSSSRHRDRRAISSVPTIAARRPTQHFPPLRWGARQMWRARQRRHLQVSPILNWRRSNLPWN